MDADAGSSKAATFANEQRKRAKDGTTDETPRVKRQRVSRACDQCRAGREKCDGLKPKCGTCAFSERPCSYDTQAKKRGIQPGYIRTLELSLAWIFSKFPTAESVLKEELATGNSQVQKLLSSKEGSESDRLHIRWSKGVICKQIDQLLSGVQVSPPSMFGPECDVSGSDDILKDIFLAEDVSKVVDISHGPAPSASVDFYPSATKSDTPGRSRNLQSVSVSEPAILHLPMDFWRLLDVYYSFTHSWLPISEKHDMLKAAYSYPPEGLRIQASEVGSGNHAELWAILALAAHQANPRKQQDEIDSCMIIARNLLPTESGPFELGHIRALILLSLIHIGRGDRTPAWLCIGIAIRIAYDLRLHERVNLHLPRRKHVWLACYIIEAILGRLYGMTCHLGRQGKDPSILLEEDGLEEWNPWDGGIIVTSQQNFGVSRKPAQSLSIFNRLLGALRDVETSDITARIGPGLDIRNSRNPTVSDFQTHLHGQGRGSNDIQRPEPGDEPHMSGPPTIAPLTKRSSTDDNDPWTPQRLQFEVTNLWLESENNLVRAKDSWPAFTNKMNSYLQCFGASRIPPVAVPLLERLVNILSIEVKDVTLRNTLGSLSHIWRQETPIQAIAFQTTPGQDASPASILGDPSGSILRYNPGDGMQMLHPMNPPAYNGTFGVDPGTYRPFLAGQELAQRQSLLHPPQSDMSPNLAHASVSTGIASTARQPPIPSVNQNMDFMSHERTQTADLEAIFEEIAMLDGNRQSGDRPEFMRNLGLGPDLDLSAFFGADYQPSDPLFSYLQSDAFGNQNDGDNLYQDG